jgi:hypothetical protein
VKGRGTRHLHDLVLRGRDQKELTWPIHEHLVAAVGFAAGDDLVEIDCGDGTVSDGAADHSAFGLLATGEESRVDAANWA